MWAFRRAGARPCAAMPMRWVTGCWLQGVARAHINPAHGRHRQQAWPNGPTCPTVMAGWAWTRAATGTCATTAAQALGPLPAACPHGQGLAAAPRQAGRLHPAQLRPMTRANGSSRTGRSACMWNWSHALGLAGGADFSASAHTGQLRPQHRCVVDDDGWCIWKPPWALAWSIPWMWSRCGGGHGSRPLGTVAGNCSAAALPGRFGYVSPASASA
jgi:hypothetical protein